MTRETAVASARPRGWCAAVRDTPDIRLGYCNVILARTEST